MMRSFFRYAPFGLGMVLIAAIVHVAIILVLPRVASSNAAARLMSGAQLNGLETLQPTTGKLETLPLPFADPALVTAVCRFEIDEAPLRIRVGVPESILSVAILSPQGRMIQAITDRAATRRQLTIVLATAEQIRQLEAQDPDDEPVQEFRLRMSETSGIAVIRALALRETEKEALLASLARSTCRPEQG
jgi:uncharacterized membrane protein